MASTVTGFATMDPQPRAELVVEAASLHASVSTVNVLQQSEWGTVTVRDGAARGAVGGFALTDYELPVGVPVEYRIEQFNSSGAPLGFASLTLETQVDIPVGWAVMSDPLAPENAVLVRSEVQWAQTLRRRRPTTVYQAGFETIGLSGVQSKLLDVGLRCMTGTATERATLEAIVAETLVLVRTMPKMRLPGQLYVLIPDDVAEPLNAASADDGDGDRWDLVGQEVSRPTQGIVIPAYTWQDVIDYYPTWTALMAARASWLAVLADPPP